MKVYLPFGDWSGDGHKQFENILVDISSKEKLIVAQHRIKLKYGNDFFKTFANEYQNPQLSKNNWQALIDTNMPIFYLQKYDECNNWSDCFSIEDALKLDPSPYLSLDFIVIAFIWIMNKHGAEITQLPLSEDILQINGWTCPGFETVGYGCFD